MNLSLDLLKSGKKLTCPELGGCGAHMFLVTHPRRVQDAAMVEQYLPTDPFIVLHTAAGHAVPWVPSQAQLLSERWKVCCEKCCCGAGQDTPWSA